LLQRQHLLLQSLQISHQHQSNAGLHAAVPYTNAMRHQQILHGLSARLCMHSKQLAARHTTAATRQTLVLLLQTVHHRVRTHLLLLVLVQMLQLLLVQVLSWCL
jgi:hypothetical protein